MEAQDSDPVLGPSAVFWMPDQVRHDESADAFHVKPSAIYDKITTQKVELYIWESSSNR
jgi:hypothetical protein